MRVPARRELKSRNPTSGMAPQRQQSQTLDDWLVNAQSQVETRLESGRQKRARKRAATVDKFRASWGHSTRHDLRNVLFIIGAGAFVLFIAMFFVTSEGESRVVSGDVAYDEGSEALSYSGLAPDMRIDESELYKNKQQAAQSNRGSSAKKLDGVRTPTVSDLRRELLGDVPSVSVDAAADEALSELNSGDPALPSNMRAERLWKKANAARTSAGLAQVRLNGGLNESATNHAVFLVRRGYVDGCHTDSCNQLTGGIDSQFALGGEVIGFRADCDAATMFENWMHSEAHREIILNPAWTEVGIGVQKGVLQHATMPGTSDPVVGCWGVMQFAIY